MDISEILQSLRDCDYAECKEWADAIEEAMREPVAVSPKFACLEWIPTASLPPPGSKLFAFPPDAAGEIERLRAKLTECDGKLGRKPCQTGRCMEFVRLREALDDASKALDLAQSLLERSAHHARILGAYERTRAALNTEDKG